MNKCPECGAEVREGLTFCPKCGMEFDDSKKERAFDPNATEEREKKKHSYGIGRTSSPKNNSPKDKKFYERTWFIIIALIFFWPLGVFLMWKFSEWKKAVKIIISIICAIVLICMFVPSDEADNPDNANTKQVEQQEAVKKSDSEKDTAVEKKYQIKEQEGFNKLQSFYLQISDKDTENKVIKMAKANGFNYEITSVMSGMEEIDISKSKGERGPGAEPWYMFKTDSIHLFMTTNDENEADDKYYVFSKDYYVRDTYMSVNYTFYDKELYTENRLPGYSEGAKEHEEIDTWNSVEEALKYALEYEK